MLFLLVPEAFFQIGTERNSKEEVGKGASLVLLLYILAFIKPTLELSWLIELSVLNMYI